MKRPKPEMLQAVDEMMRCWQSPQRVALALKTRIGNVYNYADHLGYRRVYITKDEIELLAKYRLSRNTNTQ